MFNFFHKKRNLLGSQKGFTLIELLVVIAIIGLISTLAIVALGSAREKARDQARISRLKQIQTGLEIYFTENNKYPIAPKGVVLGSSNASCLSPETGFAQQGCENAVMAVVPSDPGENQFIYTSSEDGSTYQVQASLEGEASGLSNGIVVTPSGIKNTESSN